MTVYCTSYCHRCILGKLNCLAAKLSSNTKLLLEQGMPPTYLAAADRQVVVATHSPYFVNWSDLNAGAKVYRFSLELNGIAIGSLQADTLTDLNRLVEDWQKPNLLDAVAREIFFADEVVFLEGQEDVGLIRKFTEQRELPPLRRLDMVREASGI